MPPDVQCTSLHHTSCTHLVYSSMPYPPPRLTGPPTISQKPLLNYLAKNNEKTSANLTGTWSATAHSLKTDKKHSHRSGCVVLQSWVPMCLCRHEIPWHKTVTPVFADLQHLHKAWLAIPKVHVFRKYRVWLAGRNTEFSYYSCIRLGPWLISIIRNTEMTVIRSQVCIQLMGNGSGPQPTVHITKVSVIQRPII